VYIFRRGVPWILLCVALAAGGAYGISKNQTKGYTATASLVFENGQPGQPLAGVRLARGDVAAKTAAQLGQGLTTKSVSAGLRISTQGASNVVQVSDTATTPVLAAGIANTYAEVFVKDRQGKSRATYASALKVVDKQLAALSPKDRAGPAGLALQKHAKALTALEELNDGGVQVAQPATSPTSPSSPKLVRNTVLGAVVGLLLGLGIALVLAGLDRRISDPRELAAIYGLPLLGVVPQSRALARSAKRRKGSKKALPPREAEAFNLIRAHVRSFNVDIELGTLLVVSAAPGDGKTTVARQFASAAARRGLRVLLLEADLRHPTLTGQLDVQPGPGVSDVLTGTMSLSEVTQMIDLDATSEGHSGERTLDVAVAGAALPPNPGELIESRAMELMLERAKSTYDLVVIDTPPLVAVSDAFPLLSKVDGVMIVGRVGRNRSDVVERLQETLTGARLPLLGVVANGFRVRRRGAYGYPYDYTPSKAGPTTTAVSANGAPGHSGEARAYGEAVDLFGLLVDLPQEPPSGEADRGRTRRAPRRT
jgi:capsular exopolysaccharide synthesis family protein